MKDLTELYQHFELGTEASKKPRQVCQDQVDVILAPCSQYKPGCPILHLLKLLCRLQRQPQVESIAVVGCRDFQSMGQCC